MGQSTVFQWELGFCGVGFGLRGVDLFLLALPPSLCDSSATEAGD